MHRIHFKHSAFNSWDTKFYTWNERYTELRYTSIKTTCLILCRLKCCSMDSTRHQDISRRSFKSFNNIITVFSGELIIQTFSWMHDTTLKTHSGTVCGVYSTLLYFKCSTNMKSMISLSPWRQCFRQMFVFRQPLLESRSQGNPAPLFAEAADWRCMGCCPELDIILCWSTGGML